MKRADDTHYELSTGRKLYAYDGVIGLSPGKQELFEGWDGWLGETGGRLTDAEKREIAEFMIAEWRRWGEAPQ